MKEALFTWIQDIAFYSLLMSVILHVLPDRSQKKYLQFFMGIVLIILVITPLLSAGGLAEELDASYARQTYDQELMEFQQKQEELQKNYEQILTERLEEADALSREGILEEEEQQEGERIGIQEIKVELELGSGEAD